MRPGWHDKKASPMRHIGKNIRRFLISEDGPTAVEYAVMLVLILMVCIVAIQAFGTSTAASFTNSDAAISAAMGS
jgi:pilus assembly protein Flp/PilA